MEKIYGIDGETLALNMLHWDKEDRDYRLIDIINKKNSHQ